MPRKIVTLQQWMLARSHWEGEARCTLAEVASMLEISKQAVQKHAKKNGWNKCFDKRKVADQAHQLADALDKQETPAQMSRDDGRLVKKDSWSTTADKHFGIPSEEMRQQSEHEAVERRAKVIDRHRIEWDGVRSLVYQAIRSADFDKAKLAKITAEAVRIVQEGERKAWDLDRTDEYGKPQTIVIERYMGADPVIREKVGKTHAKD